jgi:trimethylamine--corrinoid protein Co-methyltransferase
MSHVDAKRRAESIRSGGRAARRTLRATRDFRMLPGLMRRLPVTEIMDGAQIEMIDAASMDILENVGVQFRDPIALEDWRVSARRWWARWSISTAASCAT